MTFVHQTPMTPPTYILTSPMHEAALHQPASSVSAPQSRLIAGSLSVLLMLALAFAAGIPASELLASVGGASPRAATERALPPQTVEARREAKAQLRPTLAIVRGTGDDRSPRGREINARVAEAQPPEMLRASLLALPPPMAA